MYYKHSVCLRIVKRKIKKKKTAGPVYLYNILPLVRDRAHVSPQCAFEKYFHSTAMSYEHLDIM